MVTELKKYKWKCDYCGTESITEGQTQHNSRPIGWEFLSTSSFLTKDICVECLKETIRPKLSGKVDEKYREVRRQLMDSDARRVIRGLTPQHNWDNVELNKFVESTKAWKAAVKA